MKLRHCSRVVRRRSAVSPLKSVQVARRVSPVGSARRAVISGKERIFPDIFGPMGSV